jgi:uncharacterized protein (DUF983 family)
MARRRGKPHWRDSRQRCPHCGYRGLRRLYRGRRLMLERCPDCRTEWPHAVKAMAGKW